MDQNRKYAIIVASILLGSIALGYGVYRVFLEYFLKPEQMPKIDAYLKRGNYTLEGVEVILKIRNVQVVPITWDDIRVYVKEDGENWNRIEINLEGYIAGGQEVSLGAYKRGSTVYVKIVYYDEIIWESELQL